MSKRLAHSLASKQISQISSGGFDSKNFWENFNLINPKPKPSLNILPQKPIENQPKIKSQDEENIKNYQNPHKLMSDFHEIIPAPSLSHKTGNSEMMKNLEVEGGLNTGI